MEYYSGPHGEERMLRSRIRRGFIALTDLHPVVESLDENTANLPIEIEDRDLSWISLRYQEGYLAFTGEPQPGCLDREAGIEQVQDRLLSAPESAEHVRRMMECIQNAATAVIQQLASGVDAGDVDPNDDQYQALRGQAMLALGYTAVVTDAIDSGFIRDTRRYQLEGASETHP